MNFNKIEDKCKNMAVNKNLKVEKKILSTLGNMCYVRLTKNERTDILLLISRYFDNRLESLTDEEILYMLQSQDGNKFLELLKNEKQKRCKHLIYVLLIKMIVFKIKSKSSDEEKMKFSKKKLMKIKCESEKKNIKLNNYNKTKNSMFMNLILQPKLFIGQSFLKRKSLGKIKLNDISTVDVNFDKNYQDFQNVILSTPGVIISSFLIKNK